MPPIERNLRRRLAPLFAAAFLQSFALWVPIEKLFMTQIGYDAASIGVMAAVYAVAVPIFEVPSGVLADRWSRRGVLLLAGLASVVSVTIGGLSQNVPTYMVSALFLGIFFAMQSGTFDSVVYDTVLEESGDSDSFERTIGRVRLVESIALVASALTGAAIAQLAPLPATYFLTIVPLVGSFLALLRFREPELHKAEEGEPLRRQLAATYRAITQRGRLRLVVGLIAVSAVLMQGMLEFGPLWLVALAVPTVVFGPHWAGLTAALGLGGLLGSAAWLTRRRSVVLLASLAIAACVVLAVTRSAGLVIVAQILLILVMVAVGIPATRRLHDAVPSAIRASVASGVGTLTWIAFVPFALLAGFISDRAGVASTGWLLVAVAVVGGSLMLAVLPAAAPGPIQSSPEPIATSAAPGPAFAPDRFRPDSDPDWPGHWAHPPSNWKELGLQFDGDASALSVVQAAISAMPPPLRQVITLRDVQGRSPTDVEQALQIDVDRQRDLLHRARGLVRERLERHLAEEPRL